VNATPRTKKAPVPTLGVPSAPPLPEAVVQVLHLKNGRWRLWRGREFVARVYLGGRTRAVRIIGVLRPDRVGAHWECG